MDEKRTMVSEDLHFDTREEETQREVGYGLREALLLKMACDCL